MPDPSGEQGHLRSRKAVAAGLQHQLQILLRMELAHRHTQRVAGHAREELARVDEPGSAEVHGIVLLLERQDHIEQAVTPAAQHLQLPPEFTERVARPTQGGAHRCAGARHQRAGGLVRVHIDVQHQHADEHPGGAAVPPARAVQRGHTDQCPAAAGNPTEVQGQRAEKVVERALTARRGHERHRVIVTAVQGQRGQMCRCRPMARAPGPAPLDQRLGKGRDLPIPVVRIARKRFRQEVLVRLLDELGIPGTSAGHGRRARLQQVVELAPADHDLRSAPAVHHDMVELQRQAVQVFVDAQQHEAPGRCAIERERLRQPFLPPGLHRGLRIASRRQVAHLQDRLPAGQQVLPAPDHRRKAQRIVLLHQQAQGLQKTRHIERAFQQCAAADHQVRAVGPGHTIAPDLALAQRQGHHGRIVGWRRRGHVGPFRRSHCAISFIAWR